MPETYREFVLVNEQRANDLEEKVEDLNIVLRHSLFTDEPDVAAISVAHALMDIRDIRKTLETIEREVVSTYKANT